MLFRSASALCLSSLPCLLLLYHSHRAPGLYVFQVFRALSHVTVSIPQIRLMCKHLFVLYFTTFHLHRLRRPFQSAYPSVFSQKTRKPPAAARRGLSLWVSMKFYIICVYCFSAFPCYEIFYMHINLRLPELLIQIQSVEAA